MEIITLGDVDEDVLTLVKQLVELVGPPPIDIVVIGAEETRLEPGEIQILKVALPVDRYILLREVALSHALIDPQLLEVWAVPPELATDRLAHELSAALLKRLLDAMVAKVNAQLAVERAKPEVVEGDTVAYTLVRTFAVDASASLAVAGHMSEALQLITKLAPHPIYEKYRRFWDFAVANFKHQPIYNWLQLMYG